MWASNGTNLLEGRMGERILQFRMVGMRGKPRAARTIACRQSEMEVSITDQLQNNLSIKQQTRKTSIGSEIPAMQKVKVQMENHVKVLQ